LRAASPPQAKSSSQEAPAPAQSQAKLPNQNDTYVIRKDVDEVLLHASVVDDKQHIVRNLGKNDFSVFEDGKPQTIISFRNEDIPVAMGIDAGETRQSKSGCAESGSVEQSSG
jgi:Ca-activated chloride channel family protein